MEKLSTKSLSPGEALRAKHAEARQNHHFALLAQSLLKEDVAGDAVERLHQAIAGSGGNKDQLSLVETELAFAAFFKLQARI